MRAEDDAGRSRPMARTQPFRSGAVIPLPIAISWRGWWSTFVRTKRSLWSIAAATSSASAFAARRVSRAVLRTPPAIDMFVYPDEHHVKWQPAHRLATYARAIAWFDFWLNGIKAPGRDAEIACWQEMPQALTGPSPSTTSGPGQTHRRGLSPMRWFKVVPYRVLHPGEQLRFEPGVALHPADAAP